jgi:hypothetical protein
MDRLKKYFGKLLFMMLVFPAIYLIFPGQVHAVEPAINDIVITSNNENVLLYARLVNGFNTEMESAILAGAPSVFTLLLEVYQVRSVFWDKKIASYEIKRTIKYDNLKKTFSILTNGNEEPVIFPDFESAQKAMADFSGITIVPHQKLVKGNNYYLRMKVKIDKVRLPLHMEYVFLFVSFWDFETVWYNRSFSH